METPLHSSEPPAPRSDRPKPLSLCARRDHAPARHCPLLDLAGYAVLSGADDGAVVGARERRGDSGDLRAIVLAVYPWLEARRRVEVVRCAPADAVRILLTWAGLGFAMLLLYQIVDRFAVPAEAVSALLILLVSLTTFVAGLSGFATLFGVGLARGVALAIRLLWQQSGWLLFGVVLGVGLIGGTLVERRAENK